MSGIIKVPDSSTCGSRDWQCCAQIILSASAGSFSMWQWAAVCWLQVRWHRGRLVKTTDIINCNLASKDEWRRNALICDSELSCSIYRKTCFQGNRERACRKDRQTETERQRLKPRKELLGIARIFSQITDDLNEYEGSGREYRTFLAVLSRLEGWILRGFTQRTSALIKHYCTECKSRAWCRVTGSQMVPWCVRSSCSFLPLPCALVDVLWLLDGSEQVPFAGPTVSLCFS